MVAKFVSVEDFAIRAGLGDVDSLDDSVTAKAQAAIEGATIHLISFLRTEFDAATLTDIYYVDSGEFPFVGKFPRFYLSQGFVTSTQAQIDLHVHHEIDDISNALYHIDTKWVQLDQTKGTVLLTGTDQLSIPSFTPTLADGNFVQIIYAAGFQEAADAFGSMYVGAPDWLAEAAQLLAKSIFDNGVPCDDKGTNSLGCCISIEALVNRYIRYLPSALKPMN